VNGGEFAGIMNICIAVLGARQITARRGRTRGGTSGLRTMGTAGYNRILSDQHL